MSEIQERRVGEFTLRIDRHLCVGFGDCIEVAPELLEFDDEGIAVVRAGAAPASRELLVETCRSCPVDALTLHDPSGAQLAP